MKYKKKTLPNGLRVITIPMVDNPSVMVMVAVETGSDYESKVENGISHFLEHMCFKGTSKRPKASDIALELDSLGAANNASTSNEFTNYYAKASKKHFKKIFEIVSDMYLNPTLPAKDLETERGVILQEISMYQDMPQYMVWEVMYKLMYGDVPMGRPIIGPRENIKKFTRKDFVNYRSKHYLANKTLMFVAGDVSEKEVLSEVKKYFGSLKKGKKQIKTKPPRIKKGPSIALEHKKTDQTHLVIGMHSYDAQDKRSIAADLLSGILGHGMSSRLFHRLREVMGACYYARAGTEEFTDHGIFAVSTGIEASRIEEVIKAIMDELRKLTQVLVSDRELNKAKEHYVGHLYMNLETTDDLARFYLDQEITTRKMKLPGEIEKEIRKMTPKDIMKVAKEIFRNDNLNLAVVGDIKDQAKLKKALKL